MVVVLPEPPPAGPSPTQPPNEKHEARDEGDDKECRGDRDEGGQAGDCGDLTTQRVRANLPPLGPVRADVFVECGGKSLDRVGVGDAGPRLDAISNVASCQYSSAQLHTVTL